MCKNVRKTRSQIAAVGPLVAWSEPSFANGYGGQWTGDIGEWEEGKAESGKGQGTKCCPAVGDGDTGSINRLAGGMGHFVVGCGCGIGCGL